MKKFEQGCKAVLATAGLAMLLSGTSEAFSSLHTLSSKAVANTTGGSISMSIAIKKVADNTVDTSGAVNWANVALPATWKVADDYIQLTSNITQSGGGIQTYTDNLASDASPKFTGNKTVTTPAGLINTSDPTKKLPTAWTIRHTTGTISAVDPGAGLAAPQSFSWFYHEDKSQVAIPSANATAFTNGIPFVTVQNTAGIHYAQGDSQFGPNATGNPPLADNQNDIYVEANFASAVAPQTYQTTTLRLEAYTE